MLSFALGSNATGSDHVLPPSAERVSRRSFMSDWPKLTSTVPDFVTHAAGWMWPLTLLAMRTGVGGQASAGSAAGDRMAVAAARETKWARNTGRVATCGRIASGLRERRGRLRHRVARRETK